MTQRPTEGGLSGSTMAMLGGLVVILVAGFIVLSVAGRDVGSYTLFVAGPLVTTVVGALINSRVRAVEEVARTVEKQTNGLLSKQFSEVHDHLDSQTQEISSAIGGPPAAAAADPRLPTQAPVGAYSPPGTSTPLFR